MVQTWYIDNLRAIGGHPVEVLGSPRVVTAPTGRGIWFDGADDAVLLPAHPLEGAARYTAEVIFRPESGGSPEQRFFHLQEAESDDRILFETRLTPHGTWYLDTFIKSRGRLQSPAHEHEHLDAWYHRGAGLRRAEVATMSTARSATRSWPPRRRPGRPRSACASTTSAGSAQAICAARCQVLSPAQF